VELGLCGFDDVWNSTSIPTFVNGQDYSALVDASSINPSYRIFNILDNAYCFDCSIHLLYSKFVILNGNYFACNHSMNFCNNRQFLHQDLINFYHLIIIITNLIIFFGQILKNSNRDCINIFK
jgi:hypothetical protein